MREFCRLLLSIGLASQLLFIPSVADDLFQEGFFTNPDDLPGGKNYANSANIPYSTDTDRYSDGITASSAFDATSPHFPEYDGPQALVDDRYLHYTNYIENCAVQGISPVGAGDQVREAARLKITDLEGYQHLPPPRRTFVVYAAIKWNPSDFAIQEGEFYNITVRPLVVDLTPTTSPTLQPTQSMSPTLSTQPTFTPETPTIAPTIVPTTRPTTPTIRPTARPSLHPTTGPTGTSAPTETPIVYEGQYWNDGGIRVDANGYSSYFDAISNCYVGLGRCRSHLKKARRLPDANWMSLACSIGEFVRPLTEIEPGFESSYRWMPLDEAALQPTIFNVGESVTFRAVYSGQLICFANDAHTLYWNNYGQLQVTVQRVSWPPTNSTVYKEFLVPSCDSAFIVYQMQQYKNDPINNKMPICNELGDGAGWRQEDIDSKSAKFGSGAPEEIFSDMSPAERNE